MAQLLREWLSSHGITWEEDGLAPSAEGFELARLRPVEVLRDGEEEISGIELAFRAPGLCEGGAVWGCEMCLRLLETPGATRALDQNLRYVFVGDEGLCDSSGAKVWARLICVRGEWIVRFDYTLDGRWGENWGPNDRLLA